MKKCLIFMFCAMFAICFTGGLCGSGEDDKKTINRALEGLELGNTEDGQAILSEIPPKPTDAPNPDETPGSPNNPNSVPNGPAVKKVSRFVIKKGDEFIWRNESVTNKLQKGSVVKIILEKVGNGEVLEIEVPVEVGLGNIRNNSVEIGNTEGGQPIFLVIYKNFLIMCSGPSREEAFTISPSLNSKFICWTSLNYFTKDKLVKIYANKSVRISGTNDGVRDLWLE